VPIPEPMPVPEPVPSILTKLHDEAEIDDVAIIYENTLSYLSSVIVGSDTDISKEPFHGFEEIETNYNISFLFALHDANLIQFAKNDDNSIVLLSIQRKKILDICQKIKEKNYMELEKIVKSAVEYHELFKDGNDNPFDLIESSKLPEPPPVMKLDHPQELLDHIDVILNPLYSGPEHLTKRYDQEQIVKSAQDQAVDEMMEVIKLLSSTNNSYERSFLFRRGYIPNFRQQKILRNLRDFDYLEKVGDRRSTKWMGNKENISTLLDREKLIEVCFPDYEHKIGDEISEEEKIRAIQELENVMSPIKDQAEPSSIEKFMSELLGVMEDFKSQIKDLKKLVNDQNMKIEKLEKK